MRVALYARVSTQEQKERGYSIDAQLAALRAWAKREGHTIAGEYIDAGVSGKRPPAKRPELSRFFSDLENGLAVDVLAFTKLDRFFRSVNLYYQAADALDRHHVAWQAIQEDYETVTASGRFKVNIMLSVAENEADRTSERIKAVFDRKIENGECVNPNGLPLGYSCVDKKVVPDANAPAARAALEYYARTGNKTGTRHFLHNKYGISLPVLSVDHMLRNPLYKGQYRENAHFCEPLISAEMYEDIQTTLARKNVKHTPSGIVYLFTGLIYCAECGRRVCSGYAARAHGRQPYYRCPNHYMMHTCHNAKCPREYQVEGFLLDHLEARLRDAEYEYEQKKRIAPKAVNRAAILKKLDRLKDLYVDGLITKEQYRADYEKLHAALDTTQEKPPAFQAVHKLIGAHFREEYESFTQEEKRELWRAILDRIELSADGSLAFYFK